MLENREITCHIQWWPHFDSYCFTFGHYHNLETLEVGAVEIGSSIIYFACTEEEMFPKPFPPGKLGRRMYVKHFVEGVCGDLIPGHIGPATILDSTERMCYTPLMTPEFP